MLDKVGFETQIARLDSANLLYLVLSQFREFDLDPDVVSVTSLARTGRASTDAGLSNSPRRGDIWSTDTGVTVLAISSTVYNEIASEPTVIVVPVFATEPDTGLEWTSAVGGPRRVWLRVCARLGWWAQRRIDVQALTDVNSMLFKILATPER